MGMAYENVSIGGVTGIPFDVGTEERQIVIRVPKGRLSKRLEEILTSNGPMGRNTSAFQLLFELSIWLERAALFYPDHFNDAVLREIFTAHVQFNGNAIEKDMLHHIKQSQIFQRAMHTVLNRVGPNAFNNKELIPRLSYKGDSEERLEELVEGEDCE